MAAVIQKSKRKGTKKPGRVAKVAGEQSLPPLRLTTTRATRRRLSFRGVVVDKNQIAADAGYFWCDARASDLMENKSLQLKSLFPARTSRPGIREAFLSADPHLPRLKLNSQR